MKQVMVACFHNTLRVNENVTNITSRAVPFLGIALIRDVIVDALSLTRTSVFLFHFDAKERA